MSQGTASLPPRAGARQPAKKKKQKPKKKRSILKALFFIFFGLLIIVALVLGYLALQVDGAIDQISVTPTNEEQEEVVVPASESVKKNSVAIVLMGLDSRSHGGGLNTDVMMVAAFNPDTKSATVVSIPRDSKIDVEGYRARKANAFYADFYSSAIKNGTKRDAAYTEAKKEVRTVMSKLFGIDVKYAAVINFKGFADVIDAVGGVQVNVDMRMKYRDTVDGTNIDLQKGVQKLNGDQALDFVRYRQSNDGRNMSSDFDRNRRQSEVVSAFTDKLMSLGGAAKIGNVIEAVGNNLTMDMPSKEIKNMIAQYLGMSSSDVTFIALEGSWRSPYVYLNEAKLEEARSALQAKMAE